MNKPASTTPSSAFTDDDLHLLEPADDDLQPPVDGPPVPPPPASLSEESRDWWVRIIDDFDISDSAGLLLLRTALEALDRLRQAQQVIREDGPVIIDRFGQKKPHVLLNAERDARSQMVQALKALNLDIEPLNDRVGRPGGS